MNGEILSQETVMHREYGNVLWILMYAQKVGICTEDNNKRKKKLMFEDVRNFKATTIPLGMTRYTKLIATSSSPPSFYRLSFLLLMAFKYLKMPPSVFPCLTKGQIKPERARKKYIDGVLFLSFNVLLSRQVH